MMYPNERHVISLGKVEVPLLMQRKLVGLSGLNELHGQARV